MKNERGFTYIEMIIVFAIILIVGIIAVPAILHDNNDVDFREIFGLETAYFTEDEMTLVQPLVQERIKELRTLCEASQQERGVYFSNMAHLPGSPKELQERLVHLRELDDSLKSHCSYYAKALKTATYLGFKLE